jgi:hypothetical protein
MSGIAGGDRISRDDVQPTVDKYVASVLNKIPGFIDYEISGSYKSDLTKSDFGDIDLIITIKSKHDKTVVKRMLVDFFEKMSVKLIVPFNTGRAKGKRTYNSGELVTILFQQSGNDKYVQIDNIVALSKQEKNFKLQFLNLQANKQGIMLGLVRSAWLEYGNEALKRLRIQKPKLSRNQELEFVVTSSGISLRKVTLGSNFEELDRKVIWTSKNWDDVYKLFPPGKYDFSLPFEDLVQQIKDKGFKNERSSRRLSGIFNSMITVKSGEVGKEKGNEKERSRLKVKNTFEHYMDIIK